jgi:catechol 2,3-dioxygenase-like lactoylglutathione lyase family enzyme
VLRLGQIRQVAFVTRDIHASMAFYVEKLGVGPWFYAEASPLQESFYRDGPCDMKLAAALVSTGDMQLELVQPLCETPSMYRDWMARPFARELQQHMAIWPEDYDATLKAAHDEGYRPEQGGLTPFGRFVYLLHPDQPDLALELSELTPLRRSFYAGIAAAAQDWDGRDPVRAFADAMPEPAA